MRKPLYAIANEYMQAYHELYSDDEIPEEAIRDTIGGIKGEFEDKALNIAAIIKNMRADTVGMKDAEYSMSERRKRLEKRIERMEKYLLVNMQYANIDKPIESPEHFIAIKFNPPSVQIDANASIPDNYMRVTQKKEPDKNLLKEAINNNMEIKGVSLVKNVKLIIK